MSTSTWRSRRVSRVPILAALLVTTVALLLAFTYAALVALQATGIYSQGQSRWVQSRVRAVMHLHGFARTTDLREYEAFRESLRVPHAYARARRLLEPERADYKGAVREFTAAGMSHQDAVQAAMFARLYTRTGPARRVIHAWAGGDEQIDSLAAIGRVMRAARQRGDTAAMRALLPRIDAADRELTRLEGDFSAGLADAARTLPPLLLGVGALLGLVLITIGIVTVRGVVRAADRAQAAEREHLEKLRALMEGLPDAICLYDRSRRIAYVNPALEALAGLERERAVGLERGSLVRRLGVQADVMTEWHAAVDRAFAGERDLAILIKVPVDGDRFRWLQVRFVPQGYAGEIDSVLAIGRDVTALRESEALVREHEAQLQQAQKLEAVGRLAGGVAHEFNNILTAITANLELAMLSLPDGSEPRQDLHSALTAARRASGLTRQLLVFARPDRVERRLVDVARIVRELEVMLRRLAGEQVEIVINHHDDSGVTLADPGQLQQILLNLVSNARDAMPQGGVVQIDVEHVPPGVLRRRSGLVAPTPAEADAQGDPEGGWVVLTVRDTGSGMDDDTVERLFEPFFTTKPPGLGTGLGLPVVRGIVTRLGGRIYLETALGTGTAISIVMPAVPGAARADDRTADERALATTGEMALPRPRRSGARRDGVVLLVEDEAPVRVATRRMLESAGYTVLEAKHGDDALLQWSQRAVDLVVTDFMMPGMNGSELLARLRERKPDLPAVIVSGYTGGGTIDEGALDGRTSLLQKPFARAELLDRVEELLSS